MSITAAARRLGSALLVAGALACGSEEPAAPIPSEPRPESLPRAVLHVRDFGDVRVELWSHVAPRTVESFVELARDGFYDRTTFHRVVPGFVIQGGDPLTRDRDPRNDGQGGPGYTIPDEIHDATHRRGVLAMANSGPGSGGSQFFVVLADQPHLDGHHTIFGQVVEGMEILDRVAEVERDVCGRHGPPDRPLEDVLVESVTIEIPGGGEPAAGSSDASPRDARG